MRVCLVTLMQPCTACVITGRLSEEIIEKVRKKYGDFEFCKIELKSLAEASTVEGLELEKFPAVIIDGEQVTAGSLPHPDMLRDMIYEKRRLSYRSSAAFWARAKQPPYSALQNC